MAIERHNEQCSRRQDLAGPRTGEEREEWIKRPARDAEQREQRGNCNQQIRP